MFLVELVLQGVRGFREPTRLRFKGGFNLVIAGNESGKTTAVAALQRLLFPLNQAGALDSMVSRHTPDASRAALVMSSADNDYYRIIQDFSKRVVNLSQYNPTSKEFSLLHKDWESAARFMTGLTAGITAEDFSRIFVFQQEQPVRLGTFNSAAAPHSASSPPVSPAVRKTPGNQERLAVLRESLRKAEEAADAEYKYQSVKLAMEENRKKIASLEELGRKKAELESSLKALKAYEAIPDDLGALIEDQERRLGQKLADADELNKQIDGLKMQRDAIQPFDFVSDKLFITGCVLGVLSVILGGFVLTGDTAYYILAGGVLLALALIAGAWYFGSRKDARRRHYLKEEEQLKQELAELEKRFQQEGATLTAYMLSTMASSTAELKEKAENYRYFLSLRADLEEQRQRSLGDLTLEILQQQCEDQQREIVELEKAAQALAQFNVDTYSIRQDIERLESEASAASAGASWNFGAEAQHLPSDSDDFSAGGSHVGFLAELSIAGRVGGIEMETLVPAVEAAAQRSLSAVTAGRYVRLEAGHGGDPIVHAKDDSVVAYSELSHGTRSLITFCLRAGLVEALVGKRRFPFILDDSLADFDPARQKAACQVLRALGTKTQVILFTSNPALRAEGDAVAELK
jgi:DNA repair exonuclease SbcCD ATPase subunit